MRTWSTASDRSVIGRDPVATTAWSNSMCCDDPAVATTTRRAVEKRAVPCTTLTPARRTRPSTSARRRPTTDDIQACTRSMSARASASTPQAAAASGNATAFATWISALLGMQPALRQTPPRCSRSTRTTLLPIRAARSAVA